MLLLTLCCATETLSQPADNRKCTPGKHYDSLVKDTVSVDSTCHLVMNPSYWGVQVNDQVTLDLCKREASAKSQSDKEYAAVVLDMTKKISDKDLVISNKDAVISGKDNAISLYMRQIKDNNTEKDLFAKDLAAEKASKGSWMLATAVCATAAIVEGIVLYFKK